MFTGTASLAATLAISVLLLVSSSLAGDFEEETTAGAATQAGTGSKVSEYATEAM